MILTVDANIVISAVINSSSQEFHILSSGYRSIDFISSAFIIEELSKKAGKIAAFTQNSVSDIKKQLQLLTASFLLVHEKEISEQSLKKAESLIRGLDFKDYLYVAVTIDYDALLWTGDVKLIRGLRRKGFNNTVTTKELKEIIKGL
jgi:predicted nucleic acid-binding protein